MGAPGLFGAHAGAYRAFRPAWPAQVFAHLLEAVGAPRKRAVDLGAGTGLVAAELCAHFEEVVAVEPDARMLALLEARAGLRTVQARAEEASFAALCVDLVSVGNAFHWMDGARVCVRAREWLRPGGVLAVFRYDPPHAATGALRALLDGEYEHAWGAHVHARLRDPDYSRRTLAASAFGPRLTARWLSNELELSSAELLGFLRSTSYAGGHARSLADPEAYWRDLDERVRRCAGAGPHVLDFRIELLLASKRDP